MKNKGTFIFPHFLFVISLLLSGLSACSQDKTECLAPSPEKEVILDGLAHPWSMAFINEQEAFITEKEGDLLRIDLTSKKRYVIKGFSQRSF